MRSLFRFIMLGLAALALAGCGAVSANPSVNLGITTASTTLHSLCGTIQVTLPIVEAYVAKTASTQQKIAVANQAIDIYCAGPISTNPAEAAINVSRALTPLLPLIIRTPAALDAYRSAQRAHPELKGGWRRL